MARPPCPGLPRPKNERGGSRTFHRLFRRLRRRSLHPPEPRHRSYHRGEAQGRRDRAAVRRKLAQRLELSGPPAQNGTATCWERVGQDMEIQVVGVSLKKKNQ